MQELRHRSLLRSKAYRDSIAVWGEPKKVVRKRVIIASGLTTAKERDVTVVGFKGIADPSRPCNRSIHQSTDPVDSKYNSYRDWIWQRKRLRGDLDRCDKTHDWLKCKADLSELEEKVYKVLPYPEIKPKTKLEEQHKGSVVNDQQNIHGGFTSKYPPSIKQPLQLILASVSEFLAKKRLRLYDLFVLADRDKDWKVTGKEFLEAMKKSGIPIKDFEVDHLILALDKNNDDSLQYKELAQGRDLFLMSQRLRKHSNECQTAAQDYADSSKNQKAVESKPSEKQTVVKPSLPTSFLNLPDISISETMVMENQDKEKRLKKQKKKERHRNKTKATQKIRRSCTMGGETGLMVDRYQKQKHEEYEAILKLCHLHGVQLSKTMLEKVLLNPEDKPLDFCFFSLKPPNNYLLSEQELFQSLAPAASEPDETRHFTKDKTRKSGFHSTLIYPRASSVSPKSERMNLSSGSAYISRKTDCWMTYEEYSKLTSHLDSRFERTWKPSDDNVYWPSYVFDKVRLYLDRPRTQVRSENSIFDIIRSRTTR